MPLKHIVKRYLPAPFIKRYQSYRENRNFNRVYQCMLSGKRYLNLRMDTNNVCNLKCVFCYTLARQPEIPRFMTLSEFEYIAKNLFPITRFLALSCATEPMMTRNFAEFIRIGTSYDVPTVQYVTNGVVLPNDVMTASIKNKVNLVNVSIDAATKKTYESLRINGNFDAVINNLRAFQELKKRFKSDIPDIRIIYTAFDQNIDESIDFAKQYSGLFDTFQLNHLLPRKRNPTFKGNRVCETKFDSISGKIRKILRAQNKRFINVYNAGDDTNGHTARCAAAIQHRLISSNGDVILCNKNKLCNIFKDDYFEAEKKSELINRVINKGRPGCRICECY